MKYIMGNWKMNMLPNDALKYIEQLDQKLKTINVSEDLKVVLFVPFIDIFYANLMSEGTDIEIGAQNMYFEDSGAFTGEISAEMLKSVGIYSILVGHSERRHVLKETNEDINKKLIKSQKEDMQAIFCVGETLEENENGQTEEVLIHQINTGLANVDINNIIIAYEPVWAIGTGKVCDTQTANSICGKLKAILKEQYGKDIPILYGGSVKPENSKDILREENIDGLLVGGASLNVDDFFNIITSAKSGEK